MSASATAPRHERALILPEAALRAAVVPASLVGLVVSVAFVTQVPWATTLWPWPATPLSYIFIGSIGAAISVPMLWIAVSGETAAMEAGAIDLAVMFGGMFVYVASLLGDAGQPRLWPYVAVFGVACASAGAAIALSRRTAWKDARPMPPLVRASFGAFAVVLVGAGTGLVLDAQVFPWPLGAETSVLFGLVYLGAAAYFVHAVLAPRWSNSVGQLAGFLAYDLILLPPFFDRFQVVHGRELASLVVYVTVLVYSAALATYYLFIAEPTRIGR